MLCKNSWYSQEPENWTTREPKEALDMVEKKRGPDGLWHADDYYWNMRRKSVVKSKMLVSNVEVVDWGRKGPNKMVTLNAIRALKAAGRES
jgi:hypothetical protein